MSLPLSPILNMVKPLVGKYINEENISALFDALTSNLPDNLEEKPVIIVSRLSSGKIVGSVALMNDQRTITDVYAQHPLADLILSLLDKQTPKQ